MAAPVIGIDLGTTNSCAAVCSEDGEVTLIPYRGGEFTVPSIFAIDEKGRELVGHEAKRQWQLNPKNTIFGSKRLVGADIHAELVGEMGKHVPYAMREGDASDVVISIANRSFKVHEISGKILAKIRDIASEYLKARIEAAVVTVPAYFTDRQRQVIRLAGDSIGLNILHIINEPTAAALAYGAKEDVREKVAIYDLGGGTFDISIIEIRNRVFEVKATGGDIFLGGIDFDNILLDYILTNFQAKHHFDLRDDPVAMQRIRDAAERVKKDLSERQEAPINIPFISMSSDGKPVDLDVQLSRTEFDTLTTHLVERTFVTCQRVLDDAGLKPEEIDEVLLVGGQTRMPLIQNRIRSFFGKPPSKSVHPDEAVAIGAALYAWSLNERSDLRLQLLDVLPMAIGIEGAEGALHYLFERNCAVPNRRMFTFTTHQNNQIDLVMRIFQGDEPDAKSNALLGEFEFSGLRPGPAGSVRVEVVFDLNAEGILSLDARDLDTQAVMQKTVRLT
ncbi:MAG: Hsp70 family protein [Myxococcota bacterium]